MKTVPIAMRLPEDMFAELKDEATQLERSLSWIIRKKLMIAMEQAKPVMPKVQQQASGSLAVLGRYRESRTT
jgi:uncharacterized small protein (TIGR04563 family)